MEKFDFKVQFKGLYRAKRGIFEFLDVPSINFIKIDAQGDPNIGPAFQAAVAWLYSTAYRIKFDCKAGGHDFVVPPLEGLWWADDPEDFVARRKDRWNWTLMLAVPGFVHQDQFSAAVAHAAQKLGAQPSSLRFEKLVEGRCLQALHVGSYDDEGPLLAQLHNEIMPREQVTFNGPHHEIYLSDARRTPADRLKVILRQPVK